MGNNTIPRKTVPREFFSLTEVDEETGPQTMSISFENRGVATIMFLEKVTAGISFNDSTIPRDYEETLTLEISRVESLTPGTFVPVANLNLGSQVSNAVRAGFPANFSGLSRLWVSKHPSGELDLNFQGWIVVPPGNNILLSITDNRAPGRVGIVAVTVIWSEVEMFGPVRNDNNHPRLKGKVYDGQRVYMPTVRRES
ncbi:MAG: hypothetical protein GX050_05570 [Firmicutes bacterium]|nr:hypothetical protein [Bacillota bacterium]